MNEIYFSWDFGLKNNDVYYCRVMLTATQTVHASSRPGILFAFGDFFGDWTSGLTAAMIAAVNASQSRRAAAGPAAVSYTHLTLPTILLV